MEKVHTVLDFHDQPNAGVADFLGRPHAYERLFDETVDTYSDLYALSPVDEAEFAVRMELWAIWRRWEAVHAATWDGAGDQESYGALPEDRLRRIALTARAEAHQTARRPASIVRAAHFSAVHNDRQDGWCDFEVTWSEPE